MHQPQKNIGSTLSSGYRYSFQGQEKDDEIKGEGNSINYTYRMHDPRVGRFFAVDPLAGKYPWYTPYSFSGNKVIAFIELEGLEEFVATVKKAGGPQVVFWNKISQQQDHIMFIYSVAGSAYSITRPLTAREQGQVGIEEKRNANSIHDNQTSGPDINGQYIRFSVVKNADGNYGGEANNVTLDPANTTTTEVDGDFGMSTTSSLTFNVPLAGGADNVQLEIFQGNTWSNAFTVTDPVTGNPISGATAAGGPAGSSGVYNPNGASNTTFSLNVPTGVTNVTITVSGSAGQVMDDFSFQVTSSGPNSAAVTIPTTTTTPLSGSVSGTMSRVVQKTTGVTVAPANSSSSNPINN